MVRATAFFCEESLPDSLTHAIDCTVESILADKEKRYELARTYGESLTLRLIRGFLPHTLPTQILSLAATFV